MDRKEQKELQDLAEKLVQSCTKIAGSFLEQTAWLRRNFVVRSELQEETNSSELLFDENISISDETLDPKKTMHHFAVPALLLLADLMGPILDTILQSDEKEKVCLPSHFEKPDFDVCLRKNTFLNRLTYFVMNF